tara:strand:- start:18901 stop:19122 length:222 start_codon:yes stop_codon:yes gene_type:complete
MVEYKELSPDGKLRIPFEWQSVGLGGELGPRQTYRVPVVAGWLVYVENRGREGHDGAVTFVPDPEHRWTPTTS